MSPEKSPVIDRGQRARSRSNLLLLLAAGVTKRYYRYSPGGRFEGGETAIVCA